MDSLIRLRAKGNTIYSWKLVFGQKSVIVTFLSAEVSEFSL